MNAPGLINKAHKELWLAITALPKIGYTTGYDEERI
jgi:hypothetical protein